MTSPTVRGVAQPGPVRDDLRSARRLRLAMAVLLAVDLAGGLLAVATSVNTWGEAWGPQALLAAPVPMIVAQLVLVWLATRGTGRPSVVAAMLLAVACLVSVVSGFFDGGLRNAELGTGLFAFQLFLLAVTAAVGVAAVARVLVLLRGRRRSS